MPYRAVKRGIALLLLIGMIVGIFSAAIWFPANPTQIHPSYTKCSAEYKSDKDEEFFWRWLTHDAITVYTLMLVIFNAILAAATVRLWKSTDRLVKGAENTAAQQLRAYVGVGIPKGVWIEHGKFIACVEYTNKGQTPALKVDLRIDAMVLDFDKENPVWELPENSEDIGKGGVILPGVTWDRHCKVIKGASANIQNDIANIKEKRKRIWVWGTIGYVDVFGERWDVKFRFWCGKDYKNLDKDRLGFVLIPDIAHSEATYGKKEKT